MGFQCPPLSSALPLQSHGHHKCPPQLGTAAVAACECPGRSSPHAHSADTPARHWPQFQRWAPAQGHRAWWVAAKPWPHTHSGTCRCAGTNVWQGAGSRLWPGWRWLMVTRWASGSPRRPFLWLANGALGDKPQPQPGSGGPALQWRPGQSCRLPSVGSRLLLQELIKARATTVQQISSH